MSTFPSLSLVVLVVTYLEAGPGESSRVAQVLPCGNLSTLAFLAVFRLVCSEAGVGWATVAGYGAAWRRCWLSSDSVCLIELVREGAALVNPGRRWGGTCGTVRPKRLPGSGVCMFGCRELTFEGSLAIAFGPGFRIVETFAPLVETLAW